MRFVFGDTPLMYLLAFGCDMLVTTICVLIATWIYCNLNKIKLWIGRRIEEMFESISGAYKKEWGKLK